MLILSIDSAGDGCAACIWDDGCVLAFDEERMERGQDQRLMPLILSVMHKAEKTFEQLDRIAVTRGPGSFTGLRIGLAAARGIGLAAGKPVLGIDRFSIYADAQAEMENRLVVINSKRKELYCKFVPSTKQKFEPQMMTVDEIRDFALGREQSYVVGDICVDGLAYSKITDPEIVIGAKLAAQADAEDPSFAPRPLYIRPPDVTVQAPRFEKIGEAYLGLLTQLHAETFGDARWTIDQMRSSVMLASTRGLLAFHNNEPAGFVLCQMMDGESEILTFCVRPSHQRRGIGKKLLHEMINSLLCNATKIFLEVAADNVAACALYEQAGFKLQGHRKNYYRRGTTAVDALLMVRV